MTVFVVDTNVAIAANGGEATHADERCQLSCVKKLEHLVKHDVLAIDGMALIFYEYLHHLSLSGRPGTGDMFVKHLHNNLSQPARVQVVQITPSCDDNRGYEELPDNTFDRSDRKFLAVAVAAPAIVLNATDSDWMEHESLMDQLEVEVKQLCPQHATKKA